MPNRPAHNDVLETPNRSASPLPGRKGRSNRPPAARKAPLLRRPPPEAGVNVPRRLLEHVGQVPQPTPGNGIAINESITGFRTFGEPRAEAGKSRTGGSTLAPADPATSARDTNR